MYPLQQKCLEYGDSDVCEIKENLIFFLRVGDLEGAGFDGLFISERDSISY
jgi:hypothetical protein